MRRPTAWVHPVWTTISLGFIICAVFASAKGLASLKSLSAADFGAQAEHAETFRFAQRHLEDVDEKSAQSASLLEDTHAHNYAVGADMIAAWRRHRTRRAAAGGGRLLDSTFVELSSAKNTEDNSATLPKAYDLATQILRESYGLDLPGDNGVKDHVAPSRDQFAASPSLTDTSKSSLNTDTLNAVTDSNNSTSAEAHADTGNQEGEADETEGEEVLEPISEESGRFRQQNTQHNDISGENVQDSPAPGEKVEAETPSEPSNSDVVKKLASSLLKTGAKIAQKRSEFLAAKNSAAPKANECVMCIYTLERVQQLLTPASEYKSRSLLGGEVGRRGAFLGASRGALLPVQFPRASAYKGKVARLTPDYTQEGRQAGFGKDETLMNLGQRGRPSVEQQQQQGRGYALPEGFEYPSVDTVDRVVDGDQRTQMDANGLTAERKVSNVGGHAGGVVPAEDTPGEDTPAEDSPAEDAPAEDAPAEASARFRQLLDDGIVDTATANIPNAKTQRYRGSTASYGSQDELYPYDRRVHPPAPAMYPAPAVARGMERLDVPAPPAAQHFAPWLADRTEYMHPAMLEVASAAVDGFLRDHMAEELPDHLHASFYSSPAPMVRTMNEAAAVKQLNRFYEDVSRLSDTSFLEYDSEDHDEYVAAWLEAAEHVSGEVHGSAFHPHIEDAQFLETRLSDPDADTQVPQAGITTGTPLDGRRDAALEAVVFERTQPVPLLDQADGAAEAQPAPDAPGLGSNVYRDFAGEDAVFGLHPAQPERFLSEPMEAGQPAPNLMPSVLYKNGAKDASSAIDGAKVKSKKPNNVPADTADALQDGTVVSGAWSGGGDVSTHSNGRSGMTTEDVWFGREGYVAPGTAPDANVNMRRHIPKDASQTALGTADIATQAMRDPTAAGNKAAERIFGREGLRGNAGFDPETVPEVPLPDVGAAEVTNAGKSATSGMSKSGGLFSRKGFQQVNEDGVDEPVFLEAQAQHGREESQFIGSVVAKVGNLVNAAMFPLPHACSKSESLCPQRMRQPSVYQLYRMKRRDEQRAALNRALLSYSLALDMICERDNDGIDTEESRDMSPNGPPPETRMASYPHLIPESARRFGYLRDEGSLITEQTEWGDRVGVGSLGHYHLPDPFRTFCPKIRAKLAIVAERLLHGYDEEEVCYALTMCTYEMVQVWKAGPPTSAMGNIMNTLGMSGKVQEDQRV